MLHRGGRLPTLRADLPSCAKSRAQLPRVTWVAGRRTETQKARGVARCPGVLRRRKTGPFHVGLPPAPPPPPHSEARDLKPRSQADHRPESVPSTAPAHFASFPDRCAVCGLHVALSQFCAVHYGASSVWGFAPRGPIRMCSLRSPSETANKATFERLKRSNKA